MSDPEPGGSTAVARPDRLDWLVTGIAAWMVGGFFVDLWAHAHGRVDETFLTPWHGLLYAAILAVIVALTAVALAAVRGGSSLRSALPGPYVLALGGALAMIVFGAGDLLWHEAFGFEHDIEALLSPTHLGIAGGGLLVLSAPVRRTWQRSRGAATAGGGPGSWRQHGPAAVGLALVLAVCAAFTQYAHPIVAPLAAAPTEPTRDAAAQLWVMAADGSGQRRLTIADGDHRNPALSPDGVRLAYTQNVDGMSDIVVAMADGSGAAVVTDDGRSAHAAWSPDGTRLLFQSARAGSLDLYSMAPDGSDERRLTDDPGTEFGGAWSPDGARIAFSSDAAGSFDLWIAAADGSGADRLTSTPEDEVQPAWSPDGTRIAFSSTAADGRTVVATVAPDGSDRRSLTDGEAEDALPAWSPDGAAIAFTSDRDGDREVYTMAPDGSDQRNLSRNPGIDDGWFGPSWSPDGSSILFPAQARARAGDGDTVTQALGIAAILVQAALLAAVVLVALRRGLVPPGGIALIVAAPAVLIAFVADGARFVPGIVVAALAAEFVVRAGRFGRAPRPDVIVAFALPAMFYAIYFATLAATDGIAWPVHLWAGAVVLAGLVGVGLEVVTRPAGARGTAA